jgi:hypothetical protein
VKYFHLLQRAVTRIVTNEALDLYVLAVTAFIFTILGVTGVSSLTDLASIILALLAVLALSQIRSRHHITAMASAQRVDPFSLLATSFPSDLVERRATSSDLMLIGTTMSRTVQGSSREDMRRMLTRGGRIRILLLDPSNEELVRAASMRHPAGLTPDRLKARILGTLDELVSLRDSTRGQIEIRVASFAPTMTMSVMDADSRDGILVAQHTEYKPPGEAAPIICLKGKDGYWFSHFLSEARRIWEDGTSWPLDPAQKLVRTSRPIFQETFGAELGQSMDLAKDLLITGVSRNTLLNSSYNRFETWLRRGCQIRFLLIDPACDPTVSLAADRYYAERSPGFLRERIKHSLKLLEELQRSTSGALSVRLTPYPLAMGIIATDSTLDLRSGASAIFSEYYTYQARGEPKFALTPVDGQWYENLLGEAQAIWDSATIYPLSSPPGNPQATATK